MRLAGWVALADMLPEVSGVTACYGLCVVTWLVVAKAIPGGSVRVVVLVIMGMHAPPLRRLVRACGRGGWSPWEGSSAR